MTADDAHQELREAWIRLRSHLIDLRHELDFGDTFHVEFADKAARASNLALHLDAAVELSDGHFYGPAFVVTRSALEHTMLDWLVFLGHTHVERISGVSEERWAEWQADRKAGLSWTNHIVDWNRTRKGDVTIHRGGLFTEPDQNGNQEQLSIYYFLIEEYDGLLGKPSEQVDDGFLTRAQLREIAEENEARWLVYLRWSALVENLSLNDLIEDADRGRLGVHYAFLSTFAHPVSDNHRRLYGNNLEGRPPHYDHYASELLLLYIVTLASLELQNFRDGLEERATGVALSQPDVLASDLRFARHVTDHFWFMGSNPHIWDLHRQANDAALQLARTGSVERPAVLEPTDVQFPRDPLSRLASQHADSWGRVPAYVYRTPWPREDSLSRR